MRRSPLPDALLGLVALVLGLLYCEPARAYSWMIKRGFAKCGSCHTDPSGGETLTTFGRAEAAQLLSMDDGDAARAGFFFGLIPQPADVRLGASYRHLVVYSAAKDGAPSDFAHFPMQLDAYATANLDWLVLGGSVGVARGIEGSAHVRGAQLNRELGDGWIALSRSHFVGVRLGERALLRLGRLNLPYGLRVPEHVLWVREGTRTDRESDQQHGLALAYASGALRLEAMAIFGNYQIYPDRYRERGYGAYAELMISNTGALGVSSLLTRSNEDRFTLATRALRHAHALHGRFGLGQSWALMAEADVLKDGGRSVGYAALTQVDYEPLRGLHLMLTGEALDQGRLGDGDRATGAGKPRLGGWASVDCFLLSHLELRVDLVQRQGAPLTLQGQLHLFL